MPHLSATTLGDLDPRVSVPGYDPLEVTPGIVHIGVGGFHRAHQAVYLDRLMSEGDDRSWGVIGLGLLAQDGAMRDALREQDYLYTVLAKHPDGRDEARVVGSIIDFHFVPPGGENAADCRASALAVLTDPRIRIVSLTVTEGGYHLNDATGELEVDDALRADLARPAEPSTAFGLLIEAIARRRAAGAAPFAVMSCDNIEGNGDLAQRMLVAFARLRDPALAAYVDSEVAFPNSMVDRITPATTHEDCALLRDEFGVEDAWPVVCEPFTQWVLEDRFPAGRPAFEQVGVELVDDVRPYELMKLRLLNASHQAVGYLGRLLGHEYVHEAVRDPLVEPFLRAYLHTEAAPTLAALPGVDVPAYIDQVVARFGNARIADTLARVCADTSDRIPKFVLPVVRDQLAAGGEVGRAALVVAAWARYAEGSDEVGAPIHVIDRRLEAIRERARAARLDPATFLSDDAVFGDLAANPRFTVAFTEALGSLQRYGVRATLARLNEMTTPTPRNAS